MKIVCNQREFAALVRSCAGVCASVYTSCSGCVFSGVCTQGGDPADGDIMFSVEDICEIQEVTADG